MMVSLRIATLGFRIETDINLFLQTSKTNYTLQHHTYMHIDLLHFKLLCKPEGLLVKN